MLVSVCMRSFTCMQVYVFTCMQVYVVSILACASDARLKVHVSRCLLAVVVDAHEHQRGRHARRYDIQVHTYARPRLFKSIYADAHLNTSAREWGGGGKGKGGRGGGGGGRGREKVGADCFCEGGS